MSYRAKRLLTVLFALTLFSDRPAADTFPLQVLDPNLRVTTVLAAGSLAQPIGIVFLSQNDFLVIEKASGQAKPVHTIHRHFTSILRTLDLPTRAAAAPAVRAGAHTPPAVAIG
jgi:hypothetical protein